jgi:hypothetical protein
MKDYNTDECGERFRDHRTSLISVVTRAPQYQGQHPATSLRYASAMMLIKPARDQISADSSAQQHFEA